LDGGTFVHTFPKYVLLDHRTDSANDSQGRVIAAPPLGYTQKESKKRKRKNLGLIDPPPFS
jgi:hypothetical protein